MQGELTQLCRAMGWTVLSKKLCPSPNPRTYEYDLLCWQGQGKKKGCYHSDVGYHPELTHKGLGSLERVWRRLKNKETRKSAMEKVVEAIRNAATSPKAPGEARIWQCQEGFIPRASESRGALMIPWLRLLASEWWTKTFLLFWSRQFCSDLRRQLSEMGLPAKPPKTQL